MDTCFGQNYDNYHNQTQISIIYIYIYIYIIGLEEFWRGLIAKAMILLSTVCENSLAKNNYSFIRNTIWSFLLTNRYRFPDLRNLLLYLIYSGKYIFRYLL